MPAPAARSVPKYSQVYSALRRDIESGRWREETKLPSEVDLVRQFGVSRITVTRPVRELQAAGLVQRVAGSGTFVKRSRTTLGQSFGLLIPDLGVTEIFEPICQGMMASPLARDHALVWGSAATEEPPMRRARRASVDNTSSAACRACSSRRSSSRPPRTR